MLITWRNVAFFLISSMVLGLLNQLQISRQLYLIQLLRLLTGLELLKLKHLIYLGLSTECGMLVCFTNLGFMEFQVIYLALQEYPVNAGVPQVFILVSTLFLLYINSVPNDAICIMLFVLMILFPPINLVSGLWPQVLLASQLESDLWDTVDLGNKWFVQCWKNSTSFILPV